MFYIIFITILLDQLTKFWILKHFYLGESLPVIQNIFHITFVTNTGVAFGAFSGQNLFFILFTIIFLGVIFFYRRKLIKEKPELSSSKILNLAIGLLAGGATGNLIDRIFRGNVIDFLDFRVWPVFNVADTCICIAAVLFFIIVWFDKQNKS